MICVFLLQENIQAPLNTLKPLKRHILHIIDLIKVSRVPGIGKFAYRVIWKGAYSSFKHLNFSSVLAAKRERSDKISKKMGDYLLKANILHQN